MATSAQLVQQMYIAYYQRPADPDGLAYWVDQIATSGSWEAVAGAFGNPENAEYDNLYGGMSRADLVTELYQSVFGRVAVQDEIDFWVASEHIDQNLGFAIINGAQNADLDLMNNKVKFAELLAAEVGTNDAYAALGENVKSLLDAVTADTEVTAEYVAEVVAEAGAGGSSELTAALEGLQSANADKAEFLKTADKTEAEIGTDVTTADGLVAAFTYDKAGVATVVYAPGDSDGVKAAKVKDAQDQQAKNLADEQKVLDAAKAEVAKVAGLTSAIDLYNVRTEAQKATAATLTTAVAEQAAAVAAYDSLNTTTITVAADGTVGGLIELNAAGRLALVSGVTETTNAGVGALLAAAQANVDADAANDAALAAIDSAKVAILYLDYTAGAKDAMAAAFNPPVTGDENIANLTQAAVQAEINKQKAATPGSEAALQTAKDTFEGAAFTTAATTQALIDAQTDVVSAEKAISDLADLLSDLAEAKELAGDLKGYNDAIVAAEKAFEDLGVEVPVSIAGTVVGTAENDVFLAGDADGSIVNFNAQGEDSIFFGTDFAGLVLLDATQSITDRLGDASDLEIFVKQQGADVVLYVEQETFAGNGSTDADIVEIILSGVSAQDLVLADGFLTVA